MDDDVRGKKVAARLFDPQVYIRKKAWLTFFQLSKVQNPLCDVWQNHEDDLPSSLRATEYLYDAGLKTAVNSCSGKLIPVSVGSMVEHRGKERFL